MIYPIYLYGSPVLRGECENVTPDYENLPQLLEDMFETMSAANGIGLAAPQIGKPLDLFCIDLSDWDEEDEDMPIKGNVRKRVFINSEIYERSDEQGKFKEGCLSLPGINEDVLRSTKIKIRFMDEKFESHDQEFDGIWARVIQHEYDHIKGKVFTDHIAPIRKNLIKSKLNKLANGVYSAKYRCKK